MESLPEEIRGPGIPAFNPPHPRIDVAGCFFASKDSGATNQRAKGERAVKQESVTFHHAGYSIGLFVLVMG